MLKIYFFMGREGPLCSLSHWFSGCLVFSCLGISKVKKEARSTVACRRLRRREAAAEPRSVSKYI